MQNQNKSTNVYGIDLGTTNSVISCYLNNRFEPIAIDGSKLVPSVVAYDGKDCLVGIRAKDYSKIDPENAILSVKRKMGQDDFVVTLGKESLSAVQVSSRILGYMKAKAEEVLQASVRDVVITVPAYFKDNQRRATLLAGQMAGLNVLRIINEPTAAALTFASKKSDEKWIVYDLGGGTFDVTIIHSNGEVKEVLSSTGSNFLGGDDFDEKIVNWLVDQIRIKHSINVGVDKIVRAKLRGVAEEAKIQLSVETSTQITGVFEFEKSNYTYSEVLTRKQFEDMILDLVESTIAKTKEALQAANCSPKDISRLLLVGGSTRIPMVRELLIKEFNLNPEFYVDPDLSVSLGATMQAALASGLYFEDIVVDVSPHTLGVGAFGELDEKAFDEDFDFNDIFGEDIFGDDTDEPAEERLVSDDGIKHPLTFSPVLRRNSKLPARFVQTFYTGVPNQETIRVSIFQGESNCTKDNLFVGTFTVQIDPVPYIREVQIGMEYDLNGIVNVTVATDQARPIKSYQLNLANAGKKIEEQQTSRPQSSSPSAPLLNILVKKVEQALEQKEDGQIRSLINEYKNLLVQGKDDELDSIEDKLYSWLDA